MNKICQFKLVTLLAGFSLLLLSIGMISPLHADDSIKLELVTVQGSRELPKVIYIVPWKRLETNAKDQKLILHSLFQDAFDPLEPEAFERRVEIYKQMTK